MNIKKESAARFLLLFAFIILFFFTRLPQLGPSVVNPDGVNWHWRAEQFVVGLKMREFERTYQFYHPGVTLMWITGSPVELLKRTSEHPIVYTHYNFGVFHFVAKYTLVMVQLVLSVIAIYLLTRALGRNSRRNFLLSLGAVSLFTFEPFFLGNSRVLHLDILMTLFLFNGLLLAYLGALRYHWIKVVLAGAFIGFAFLTKSISIGGFLFAIFGGALLASEFNIRNFRKALRYALLILPAFLATVFIFWPALWVDPVMVIQEVFKGGGELGISRGHGQIIFGEYTRNAGFFFYPLVLLLKVSPLTLIGVFLFKLLYVKKFLSKELKNNLKSYALTLIFFLSVFYIGYLIVMTLPSKKIDRYMLPMYPLMTLLAVLGYYKLIQLLPSKKTILYIIYVVLVGAFLIYPIVNLHPYHFTYTSPVFGTAENANRIIAHKPFGVGIPALKQQIFDRHGVYPMIGFYDTKPMRAIYINSRIFDVRNYGSGSYDVMVLALNEAMPPKVVNSDYTFKHDFSFYINGLEYWRVYVKSDDVPIESE
jgi:hypothetical protein